MSWQCRQLILKQTHAANGSSKQLPCTSRYLRSVVCTPVVCRPLWSYLTPSVKSSYNMRGGPSADAELLHYSELWVSKDDRKATACPVEEVLAAAAA